MHTFPKEVRTAKTVAIINNTRNEAVEQGAVEALKRWGHLSLVYDTDTADIVLTFDKQTSHEGTSTTKTGDDGKPSTSYGMTFGSAIYMKAVVKGASSPFYTNHTGDSKKKAGATCVTDLQEAFNSTR